MAILDGKEILLVGLKGDKGDKGDRGERGARGERGEKGGGFEKHKVGFLGEEHISDVLELSSPRFASLGIGTVDTYKGVLSNNKIQFIEMADNGQGKCEGQIELEDSQGNKVNGTLRVVYTIVTDPAESDGMYEHTGTYAEGQILVDGRYVDDTTVEIYIYIANDAGSEIIEFLNEKLQNLTELENDLEDIRENVYAEISSVEGLLDERITELENKEVEITVDSYLDGTSENPVQNKAVYTALDDFDLSVSQRISDVRDEIYEVEVDIHYLQEQIENMPAGGDVDILREEVNEQITALDNRVADVESFQEGCQEFQNDTIQRVEDLENNKLDKVTITDGVKVYSTSKNGQSTINIQTNAQHNTAWIIPRYVGSSDGNKAPSNNGTLIALKPTQPYQVANKLYVDEKFDELEERLTPRVEGGIIIYDDEMGEFNAWLSDTNLLDLELPSKIRLYNFDFFESEDAEVHLEEKVQTFDLWWLDDEDGYYAVVTAWAFRSKEDGGEEFIPYDFTFRLYHKDGKTYLSCSNAVDTEYGSDGFIQFDLIF